MKNFEFLMLSLCHDIKNASSFKRRVVIILSNNRIKSLWKDYKNEVRWNSNTYDFKNYMYFKYYEIKKKLDISNV